MPHLHTFGVILINRIHEVHIYMCVHISPKDNNSVFNIYISHGINITQIIINNILFYYFNYPFVGREMFLLY